MKKNKRDNLSSPTQNVSIGTWVVFRVVASSDIRFVNQNLHLTSISLLKNSIISLMHTLLSDIVSLT
jgi:hypothetical protein